MTSWEDKWIQFAQVKDNNFENGKSTPGTSQEYMLISLESKQEEYQYCSEKIEGEKYRNYTRHCKREIKTNVLDYCLNFILLISICKIFLMVISPNRIIV